MALSGVRARPTMKMMTRRSWPWLQPWRPEPVSLPSRCWCGQVLLPHTRPLMMTTWFLKKVGLYDRCCSGADDDNDADGKTGSKKADGFGFSSNIMFDVGV